MSKVWRIGGSFQSSGYFKQSRELGDILETFFSHLFILFSVSMCETIGEGKRKASPIGEASVWG